MGDVDEGPYYGFLIPSFGRHSCKIGRPSCKIGKPSCKKINIFEVRQNRREAAEEEKQRTTARINLFVETSFVRQKLFG